MLKKLSLLFLILTIIASIGFGTWAVLGWEDLEAQRGRQLEALALIIQSRQPYLYGLGALYLIGWLLSFDARRKTRPYLLLFSSGFFFGAALGIHGRELLNLYRLFVEEVPHPDEYLIALAVGCGFLPGLIVLMVESINRVLWGGLAQTFDAQGKPQAALFANRMSLLFRPGQEGMLKSVALARFRNGVRGDVIGQLQAFYDAGDRDPEVLEALCKSASEARDSERYLKHLRELNEQLPEEEEIREALLEALIEQRRYNEALGFMDRVGVAETEDALDRYATVLLAEGHVERATLLAGRLGNIEGIPFRRSQRILRDVLSRMSEYVPALNILAAQADRMAQREQKLRWLEKSYAADSRQSDIREDLMAIYRDLGQSERLEGLLEDAVSENPRDRELQIEYVIVLAQNGKPEAALSHLEPLNARPDAAARTLLLEAEIRFEQQQYEEAKKLAQSALGKPSTEDERKRTNALLSRIERAVMTVEVAEALDFARANPHDLNAQLIALQKLIDGGHAEKVVRLTDEILTNHPQGRGAVIDKLRLYSERPDVPFSILNLLADQLAFRGQFEETLAVIQQMAARAIDKVATVRDASQKILRRSPHHLATLRYLGDVYLQHGRHTEMIHSYALYLAHGGEETEQIDRALARAYLSLGDYENARRFVSQLIQLNPHDVALLKQVIPLALEANAPEDAADYLKKLEAIDARDPEVRALKEKVNLGLGERRFSFLKRELEAGKGSTELLEQLGDIARDMSNYSEAITYYQRASRDPEDSYRARRCMAKLAYCYLKKRLDDLASETLRDITISLDDDPKELASIMDILYDIGQLFLDRKSVV